VRCWRGEKELQIAAREASDRWAVLEMAATAGIGAIGLLSVILPDR
jgi:hypothetical protein